MIERRDGLGFLLEATHALVVTLACPRHDLDGDFPGQSRVVGAVDLAHAPGAERRADLIRAETAARIEAHRWDACDSTSPERDRSLESASVPARDGSRERERGARGRPSPPGPRGRAGGPSGKRTGEPRTRRPSRDAPWPGRDSRARRDRGPGRT